MKDKHCKNYKIKTEEITKAHQPMRTQSKNYQINWSAVIKLLSYHKHHHRFQKN